MNCLGSYNQYEDGVISSPFPFSLNQSPAPLDLHVYLQRVTLPCTCPRPCTLVAGGVVMHMAPGVSSFVFAYFLGPVHCDADGKGRQHTGQRRPQAESSVTGMEEPSPPPRGIHSSTTDVGGHANMSFALLGMALTWFCSQGVSFKSGRPAAPTFVPRIQNRDAKHNRGKSHSEYLPTPISTVHFRRVLHGGSYSGSIHAQHKHRHCILRAHLAGNGPALGQKGQIDGTVLWCRGWDIRHHTSCRCEP